MPSSGRQGHFLFSQTVVVHKIGDEIIEYSKRFESERSYEFANADCVIKVYSHVGFGRDQDDGV